MKLGYQNAILGRRNIIVEDDNKIYYIFKGSPYFALDNFYPDGRCMYDGLEYKNSEAAFQSAKLGTKSHRIAFTKMDAGTSKWVGKSRTQVKLRDDWDEIKYDVMLQIVRSKMELNPEIGEMLIRTYPKHIEEGNFWRDQIWGVDYYTKEGQNWLGEILMIVREEILIELESLGGLDNIDMEKYIKDDYEDEEI